MMVLISGVNEHISLGELIFDRKKVAGAYLKSFFLLDCISNMPLTLLKYISFKYEKYNGDDIHNFITLNFAYIPRIYIIFLALKVLRMRKTKPIMRRLFRRKGLGVDKSNLIITLSSLLFILHRIATFWVCCASFDTSTPYNWMNSPLVNPDAVIIDESDVTKYLASLYWSVTTTVTVGYGDIVPCTDYEKFMASFVIVVGVACQSFILSTLGNQFMKMSKSASKRRVTIV